MMRDAILVPGGFGERGFEGKVMAIRHARENNIPYLGICFGMQAAVVELHVMYVVLKMPTALKSTLIPRAGHRSDYRMAGCFRFR